MRRPSVHGVAIVLGLALSLGTTPLVLADDPTPTTLAQWVQDPPHLLVGHTVTLGATVSPWQPGDGGTIAFAYQPSGGAEIPIATIPVSNGSAQLDFPPDESARPADGQYALITRFSGSTTLAASEVTDGVLWVGPYRTTVQLDVVTGRPGGVARQHDQVTFVAHLFPGEYAGPNEPPMTGDLDVVATQGVEHIDLGTVALPASDLTIDAALVPLGTWQVAVSYSGDANWKPGASDPTPLIVAANVAEASGVGLSSTSVYPVVDGYRDTVLVRGTRLEPLALSVRITDPAGHTVRTWTKARASGAYSIPWNGRSTSGALLPAGTYRVRQTLTDAWGVASSVTSKVALSRKKLVWHTTTLTRAGAAFSSSAHSGTAKVKTSGVSYAGGVRICCGSAVSPPGYFAAVGYTFTVPSAIKISSLKLRVYANGRPEGLSGMAGIQDWTRCASTKTFVTLTPQWISGCFATYVSLPTGYALTALSASPAVAIHSHLVRGIVKEGFGTVDIARVTLTIRYAVLH